MTGGPPGKQVAPDVQHREMGDSTGRWNRLSPEVKSRATAQVRRSSLEKSLVSLKKCGHSQVHSLAFVDSFFINKYEKNIYFVTALVET